MRSLRVRIAPGGTGRSGQSRERSEGLLSWPSPRPVLGTEHGESLMGAGGFEPPKAEPTGLQPDPFGRSGTPPRADDCSRGVASASVERFDAIVVGGGLPVLKPAHRRR